MLIIVILFFSSLFVISNPWHKILPIPVPGEISYTVHGPISINGNSQFNNSNFPNNGVVSGNGSASNPYVISGWELVTFAPPGEIRIQDTNAHFIIRDCYIHGNSGGNGINLNNCTNGTVSNNIINSNTIGISLGLSLGHSSHNNTLSNNTCNSNTQYGIFIDGQLSPDGLSPNTIINNSCTGSSRGICLYGANNTVLSNNTCNSNGIVGIWLDYSSNNNTLSNNTCNSNTQYGMYMDRSSSYNKINNNEFSSNNVGMRIVGSSSFNDINNNTYSLNNGYGIYVVSPCNGSRITYNTFFGNNGAGSVYHPSHIQAYEWSARTLWNTSGFPHGYGNYWSDWTTPDVDLDSIVDDQYIIEGTNFWDWYPLTTMPASHKNIRPTASFTVDPAFGNTTQVFSVNASASSDVEDPTSALEVRWDWTNNGSWDTAWSTTKNNSHQYPSDGIYTIKMEVRDTGGLTSSITRQVTVNSTTSDYVPHGTIIINGDAQFNHTNFPNNGVVSGNGTASNPYIIEGWNISMAGVPGIQILNTNAYFIIRDCYVHDSSPINHGIWLNNVINGNISNNTVSGAVYSIFIVLSSGITIFDNNCSNNWAGITIDRSNNNVLSDNICNSNHRWGIILSTGNNNLCSNNTCNSNLEWGIYVYKSNGNTISYNNFSLNNAAGSAYRGIDLESSNYNNISENYVSNNAHQGAYAWAGSSNNRIWNNTFVNNNGTGIQAYDAGTNNWWNTSSGYGNYWSDLTGPDNIPPYGIVDWSYNLTGSAGAKDWHPLTTPTMPIPEFSTMIIPIAGLMLIALVFGRMRKKP